MSALDVCCRCLLQMSALDVCFRCLLQRSIIKQHSNPAIGHPRRRKSRLCSTLSEKSHEMHECEVQVLLSLPHPQFKQFQSPKKNIVKSFHHSKRKTTHLYLSNLIQGESKTSQMKWWKSVGMFTVR